MEDQEQQKQKDEEQADADNSNQNSAPSQETYTSKKRLRREQARLKNLKSQGLIKETKETAEKAGEKSTEPSGHKSSHGAGKSFLRRMYEDDYKKLIWITIMFTVFAILQIGIQTAMTGEFIHKGVSLKGGITLMVPVQNPDIDILQQNLLKDFPKTDFGISHISQGGTNQGIIIEADIIEKKEIERFIEIIEKDLSITKDDYSIEIIGSSLGASFFREIITSLLLSFLFMSIVVFFYFRVPIPSFIVIACAACDIIMTLAVVNLLGIKISTAGIAAFLMLVGYSVDSDMLLTARVLRRKEGTIMDAVYGAVKTGMTMTMTTLVAVTVGFFVAQSDTLKQIFLILMIGLIFDIFNTWIQNVVLLRWYLEKRPQKENK